MTDIQYVQLDSSDFLADNDFQTMNAEQRGVFWSVLLFLYTNKGKLLVENTDQQSLFSNSSRRIALLSNCPKTGSEWEEVWAPVAKKFTIKNGVLKHKRVTAELRKARKYKLQKRLAGIKGMQHRYNTVNNTVITKVSKVKVSKVKTTKKNKKKKTFAPPTLEQVQEYIRENNYDVDAQKFIWHYSKLGWKKANGKPVKNWKQTLIQVWVKRDEQDRTAKTQRPDSPQAGSREGGPSGKPATEFIR